MAFACPKCGRQYDVTLFQFGNEVVCDCGYILRIEMPHEWRLVPLRKTGKSDKTKREKMRQLQRMADKVSQMILNTEYADVDVEIAITNLRYKCEELYPDRMDLFEMIYESRFKRLWEQFRIPEQRYKRGDFR